MSPSPIHDKVEASARAVMELTQHNAEGNHDCFFTYWLQSRQDAIDITAGVLLEKSTPTALTEQLDTLFTRYVDDSLVLCGYCKEKIDESREHDKEKSEMERHIKGLQSNQALLFDNLEWHREELRVGRLDAAEMQESLEYEKSRFSAMKGFYEQRLHFRDQAHQQALGKIEDRHESLLNGHANLQVQHEHLKAALEASERARREQAVHINGLENALENAYDVNNRLTDVVASYEARPDTPPDSITDVTGLLVEGEDDAVKDEDYDNKDDYEDIKSEDVEIKDEDDYILNEDDCIQNEDDYLKTENDETDDSMTTNHPVPSPPSTMEGLEWQ
ncbi:hypothetical protein PG996_007590 [Apiospora saccharicola]|uniref:Uncharacterized protein n=1 Tax=Apiospora saccharicola TaxID=335842 RepID=A0ABR1VEY7_9PEZI